MNSDKRQTMVLIGIALLVIAGVLAYVALSQPLIYEEEAVTDGESQAVSFTDTSDDSATQAVKEEMEKAEAESVATTLQANSQSYVSYPVNLNTATLEELITIDGLGEARASAIIEYRDYIGKYTSVEQIMEIKGISESIYAEVAGYLTV